MSNELLQSDKEIVYQLLEIIDGCRTILREVLSAWDKNDVNSAEELLDALADTIEDIRLFADNNSSNANTKLKNACVCCLLSIKNCKELIALKSIEADWKLKKELVPFLDTTYLQYMYWSCVFGCNDPDEINKFHRKISEADMFKNDKSEKVDLSIIVVGYNHLDYTKKAVESVLREWPDCINTELILYNHGSSDGTLDYYKTIKNAHIIDIAINGAMPIPFSTYSKGDYISVVSNDVVIGRNALLNIFKAISEDENIGWVVPTTNNISNLQTVPLVYNSDEEFLSQTEKNNIYNPKRHEQRARLCNPLDICRADVFRNIHQQNYIDLFCTTNLISFPDDKVSLIMRRRGYKIILAKDAYCQHAGSVTVSKEIENEKKEFYAQGIVDFMRLYGVNPWGKGAYYDDVFCDTSLPKYEGKDDILILGINAGMGATPLKVRENLKEQGAKNLKLVNITDEKEYLEDLKGVSDEVYFATNISDYIVDKKIKNIDCLVVEEYEKNLEETILEIIQCGTKIHHIFYRATQDRWNYINNV